MNFSQFRGHKNVLEDFDTDLQTFFYSVLSKELNFSKTKNISGVRQALSAVAKAYSKDVVTANASEIFFDSAKKRCAYVMKHCPCFSSAVAKYFLKLVRRNVEILDGAMHCREINLCCIGGGPGTEAIAIIKVMDELNKHAYIRHKQKLHVRIVIVDLSEEWKSTAELILKAAAKTPEMCSSGTLRISFELLQADLTEPLEEDVQKVVRRADIITMVYFVSAVNGSKAQDGCSSMLRNIMDIAKQGALLFFLDSAKALHYGTIMEAARKFTNLKQIFGPYVQEFHTLSMKSIKKFIELYFVHFNAILCLTNCFLTCAGWVKVNCSIVEECQLSKFGIPNAKRRRLNKMVDKNTRKQARFRQRVEKLLLTELNMNFVTDDLDENDCNLENGFFPVDKWTLFAAKAKPKRIILGFD